MAFVWDPAAVVNVVSGVLMGALGAALLVWNTEREWNRLFGLLALFWGAQILSANTVRLTTDGSLAFAAGKLSLAFLIPLYFFITAFAATFPRPRGPFGTSPVAVAVLALPAAAALGALFFQPESLLAGVITRPDGSITLSWGPLLPYLVTAPFFGSISYALYTMMRRLGEARSPTERKQVGAVLSALGLYTAYYAPRQLASFGADALGWGMAEEAGSAEAALIALVMAATVAILLLVLVKLARRGLGPTGSPARFEARASILLVGLGLTAAVTVELVAALGGPSLELVGLFRTGSVVLIVYAVARYQLFDLDLRAKRWTAVAAAVLAVSALGVAAFLGLQQLPLTPTVEVALTALVAALAFMPALHVSFRLADRVAPQVSEAGDHLYLRKLEVYRAAVERRLAEGEEPGVEDTELARLREGLELSQRDHGVVLTLAQSEAEPERSHPSMEPGTTAFGKYELEQVLAEGGFGRVLKARDTVLNRPVVIKELLAKWRDDDTIVERFLREARIAGQLTHPNIVSVYGIEHHGSDHYILMEYVPGGTLEERLEEGPLAPNEAILLAQDVLSALGAAHEQGVVHRDVKPSNVLFDERGRAKLTDFGIAHLTRQDPQGTVSGLTTKGEQPGTLAYMSPEQARGDPVDERSDLYGAAAMLYRSVTGQPPVEVAGLELAAGRQRIAEAERPDLDDLPGGLDRVLSRALARDPGDRFPTAEAFLDALQAERP